MTNHEFNHILSTIKTLSPEQVRQLRRQLDSALGLAASAGQPALTEVELSNKELQRRLFEAGLLREIKPPIHDLTPYQNRQAVPVQGEPLSETVIRERR